MTATKQVHRPSGPGDLGAPIIGASRSRRRLRSKQLNVWCTLRTSKPRTNAGTENAGTEPATSLLYDVAIVGFGPTGAIAAALLGQYGLKVFVCDSQAKIYDKPRAIALDHEIMRVFQQIGILEDIAAFIEPFTDSHFFGVDGQLIKIMSTLPPPYPQAFPPSLVFNQPAIEAALRKAVKRLANVHVQLGATLKHLIQHQDSVELHLQSAQASPETVRAKYLVACDGASSTARKALGIAWTDLGFDQAWLIVDTLLKPAGLKKLPKFSVQFCEPTRPATMVIGPGLHRRWEFAINEGEDPEYLATAQGAWSLLARWLSPKDATLWRQASYRFHALVAQRWQAGRVFLAGDAAHQQPPFLGQGMCQGIRDAANLCWKISAVLQHQAPQHVLSSYESERQAHVSELTSRITHIGQLVGERDREKAKLRDQKLLNEHHGKVLPTPRQNVQPPLGPGLSAPSSHPAIGTLFPQAWMIRGQQKFRLDELLGRGWRLVLRDNVDKDKDKDKDTDTNTDASLIQAACDLHSSQFAVAHLSSPEWQEADGIMSAWFKSMDCAAVILRPDHYVYGVANNAAQLQQMLNHLSSSPSAQER
jgi:3-(3-hydroxy-phenyl)propionate hydroxylase